MDSAIDASASEICRSTLMAVRAGASMAPDMSVTSPPRLVSSVVNHFRVGDQLYGFSGSESPSQQT